MVNAEHFVTTSPFPKLSHLPTTQCACADFRDFAKQCNGGGGREKDLLQKTSKKSNLHIPETNS
jgi:hypothetical protein